MPSLAGWPRRFFRKEIFSPGGAAHEAVAREEVPFIWRALRLKKGDRVLDLCCGTGRHARLLARRGALVVGVDKTPAYLREARRKAPKNAIFKLGDMRRLSFKNEFDAAMNLWTSFGYFLDPKDDLKTLRGVARALKPGGLFLIDLINADFLRKHGEPRRWEELPGGGLRLEETRLREGKDPAQLNAWTVHRPGRPPVKADFFVRSYDRARLSRLLEKAGLEPVACWGDMAGGRFRGPGSQRLVLLSRKRLHPWHARS